MSKLKSFTALDFETFTPERSSACAIGLVKVVDGIIVQRFYSLINPIPDSREMDNSAVTGITREMVSVAPTFIQLWPIIKSFIGEDDIVCHNAEFDSSVLSKQLVFYSCDPDPDRFNFICTYQLTGLSLADACVKHNIDMGCHHNALDDAVACARIFLAENGSLQTSAFMGGVSAAKKNSDAKKYSRETLVPIDDTLIVNKDTPFFHARTVITGTFEAFPKRDDLGVLLQALGADVNTSISRKTNIVVIGSSAGPSKLRKIEELREAGSDIRIIYEPELIKLLLTN